MHPLAIQVMAERGIDISRHTWKLLAGLRQEPWNYVVTVPPQVQARNRPFRASNTWPMVMAA